MRRKEPTTSTKPGGSDNSFVLPGSLEIVQAAAETNGNTNAAVEELPFSWETEIPDIPEERTDQKLRRLRRTSNVLGVTRMLTLPEFEPYIKWAKDKLQGKPLSKDSFKLVSDMRQDSLLIAVDGIMYRVCIEEDLCTIERDNIKTIGVYGDGRVEEMYYYSYSQAQVAGLTRLFAPKSDVEVLLKVYENWDWEVKRFKKRQDEELRDLGEYNITYLPAGSIDKYLTELVRTQTELYDACFRKDWLEAFRLAGRESAVLYRRMDGRSPLTEAIINKAPKELMLEMLKYMGDLDTIEIKYSDRSISIFEYAIYYEVDDLVFSKMCDDLGDSIVSNIFLKCQCGATIPFRFARILLDHGADPNSLWIDQYALWRSIFMGSYDLVKLLVESGADANNVAYQAATNLGCAICWRTDDILEVIELLLRNGADPNAPCLPRQLGHLQLCAVVDAPMVVVEVLLQSGANANYRDSFGMSALETAHFRGRQEFIQKLLPVVEKDDPFVRFCGEDGVATCSLKSCSRKESDDIPLFMCAGCKLARYCNRHHQQEDWLSGHNTECAVLQQKKARDNEGLYMGMKIRGAPDPTDKEKEAILQYDRSLHSMLARYHIKA